MSAEDKTGSELGPAGLEPERPMSKLEFPPKPIFRAQALEGASPGELDVKSK